MIVFMVGQFFIGININFPDETSGGNRYYMGSIITVFGSTTKLYRLVIVTSKGHVIKVQSNYMAVMRPLPVLILFPGILQW